ncbi:DUF3825 domain-containing protein [Sunxiuqinia elliptica]|uniref:Cold shock CspA family protein n=1 Tax=Sunxiuqinia elliptica TaxID=655355 RepID=A0A4R6GK64_9BACT|nr:DUF3825 domain-containing protein [Sunxiuqinia elliptica]TDN95393.1 cold shock CspA family protein [Sunxiuqinia elliptica]TDO66875.1 cold shock CspA family protein [Sunxiuqinia elliptica]
MNTGKVKFFNAGKGFGIINDDSDNSEIFIHFSQITDEAKILFSEEKVEYEITDTDKGKNAINLQRELDRKIGKIDSFQSGFGFIKTLDSEEKYFIHYSDIEGEGFTKIEDDNEVEFTPSVSEKGLQALRVVVRDKRSALQKFAFFYDWHKALDDLSNLAQEENWDYLNDKTGNLPVLSSYITYTFKRIQNEDKIQYTTKSDGKKFACFNTGLATKKHEEIFAYFEHIDNYPGQRPAREGYLKRATWKFDRFDKESYRLMNYFKNRPELANYFQSAADLIYDTSKRLIPDFDHIADDRENRFPPSFKSLTKPQQIERIKATINTALTRVNRNYKTAIPQYYDGSIQLLLPLCLEDIEKTDVALVVAKEGEVYRANTVLSLDWAYNNARLLARPDREWLNP